MYPSRDVTLIRELMNSFVLYVKRSQECTKIAVQITHLGANNHSAIAKVGTVVQRQLCSCNTHCTELIIIYVIIASCYYFCVISRTFSLDHVLVYLC